MLNRFTPSSSAAPAITPRLSRAGRPRFGFGASGIAMGRTLDETAAQDNRPSVAPPWASVRVLGVGQRAPAGEQGVGALWAVLRGERAGVGHDVAQPEAQRVVADLGDRTEALVDLAAAQPRRHRRA